MADLDPSPLLTLVKMMIILDDSLTYLHRHNISALRISCYMRTNTFKYRFSRSISATVDQNL